MATLRMSDEEIWSYVAEAHTGILTTLRRDGVPIALPVWFACLDRTLYVNTRGKKLLRLARDSRASFLVESGAAWAELRAVHLTGAAQLIDLDESTRSRVEAEIERKYDAFRTPAADMPAATAALYASAMRWVRFTPEARVLSWDNAKITGATQ